MRERADATYLEIVHGKRAIARDFIRPDGLTQSNDAITERAHARVCKRTGRLSIRAAHASLKDLFRRVLGEIAFGDPDHWRADGTYTLAPFANLDEALRHDDVPGLKGVRLHEIVLGAEEGSGGGFWFPRHEVRASVWAAFLPMVLAVGAVVEIRLSLLLEVGGGTLVELVVKNGHNRARYEREDPDIERLVREWLLARGIMRLPGERARAPVASAAPASPAEAG